MVADRLAREDELRRCIKRKKLAFSLFKQWYWEAFDSDVQARRGWTGCSVTGTGIGVMGLRQSSLAS